MRLRHGLLVSALSLLMPLISAAASTPSREAGDRDEPRDGFKRELEISATAETVQAVPLPTPLALTKKDGVYRSAYMDAYHILSEQNACSDFFGGPGLAVQALNDLAAQIQVKRFSSPHVGVEMSGSFVVLQNAMHEYSYRLFDKALLNSNGPFYIGKDFPLVGHPSGVGRFQSNTREARTLMLLHELAHMVRKPDGEWLIPDDGGDSEQSRANTARVEEQCGQQIKEQSSNSSSAKISSKKLKHEQASAATNKTGSAEEINNQAGKKQ